MNTSAKINISVFSLGSSFQHGKPAKPQGQGRELNELFQPSLSQRCSHYPNNGFILALIVAMFCFPVIISPTPTLLHSLYLSSFYFPLFLSKIWNFPHCMSSNIYSHALNFYCLQRYLPFKKNKIKMENVHHELVHSALTQDWTRILFSVRGLFPKLQLVTLSQQLSLHFLLTNELLLPGLSVVDPK